MGLERISFLNFVAMGNDRNSLLARNTLYLYIRMGIGTIISLYTSRLVLEQLGVDGYGVYTVVGSVVVSLGFLSNALAGAVSRFFAYELGRRDMVKLRNIFNASFWSEVAIGVLLVAVLLTVGLWFIEHRLDIPLSDRFAAKVVLWASTLSFFFTIALVPYKSAVIANERFGPYALIELGIIVFKLVGVLLLTLFVSNKLIIYALLMAIVISGGAIAYMFYARLKLPECRLRLSFDFKEFSPILKYAGIDLFGHFCAVVSPQSLQWVVNLFLGVALNAAIGITNQVTGAVSAFVSGITLAFRPQMIKEYAAHNFERLQLLCDNCSVFALLMMGVIVAPLCINIEFVLGLWLKVVPPDTAVFCFISLLAAVPAALTLVANCVVHATGKIKWLSVVNGILYLLIPLVSYFLLKAGCSAYFIFIAAMGAYALQWFNSLFLGSRLIEEFSAWKVIARCILPTCLIAGTMGACFAITAVIGTGWVGLITGCLFSLATCGWYAVKVYRNLKSQSKEALPTEDFE